MSVIAYIGIGSNMGDKQANCLRAIGLLKEAGTVENVSSLYCTEPVGYKDQEDFVNAVAAVRTELEPDKLLSCCSSIEERMGRIRTIHWGPRVIDLDILLFGDLVINSERLAVPHPLMATRRFVLEPLFEIAPQAIHPVLNKSVQQLLRDLADPSAVSPCREGNTSP